MDDAASEKRTDIEDVVGLRTDMIYDILDHSYRFLFTMGQTSGNWHEVRSTSLAGMCIDRLPTDKPYWRVCVKQWLETEQLRAAVGSWGEEIWDTAMALLALKALGSHTHDSHVHAGLEWIASKYSVNGRWNWHDDPWETSWALLAIITAGKVPRDIDLLSAIRWLATLQDSEGRIIAPQFTAYFAAICHDSAKIGIELDSHLKEVAYRSSAFLMKALSESDPSRLWTGEAWSNGQILWLLAEQKLFPFDDFALVDKVLHWFRDTQNPEGGYWEDAEDTASATLGLLSLLYGLTAIVEGRRQTREAVSMELQRRVTQLPLRVNVRMLEADADSGGFLIRISRRKITLLGYVISVIAALAAIAGLWDFAVKYWVAWRPLIR